MSNPNQTYLGNGIGAVPASQLMAMQAAGQRVINPMQLAMAQPNFNLGFPTIMATNMATNMVNRVPQIPLTTMPPRQQKPPLTQGRGILRIMLFADYLGGEPNNNPAAKKDIAYWRRFVSEFFTEDGQMRFTLWNAKSDELKPFEIVNSVIPRYFEVNFDSGVSSIQLILGHAREHVFTSPTNGQPNNHTVECPKATMIYNYDNGTRIVFIGHLRVKMNQELKIELMEFITKNYTEYIPRNLKDNIPPSPVNEYGIPLKTLRSLEIAEGVAQLNDIISTSLKYDKGPIQALSIVTSGHLSVLSQQTATPPTPNPSPPSEPAAKAPQKKNQENTIIDGTSINNSNGIGDLPVSSPSPSTSNVTKNEVSTPKLSAKSPRVGDKRPNDSTVANKSKRRQSRKGSRGNES